MSSFRAQNAVNTSEAAIVAEEAAKQTARYQTMTVGDKTYQHVGTAVVRLFTADGQVPEWFEQQLSRENPDDESCPPTIGYDVPLAACVTTDKGNAVAPSADAATRLVQVDNKGIPLPTRGMQDDGTRPPIRLLFGKPTVKSVAKPNTGRAAADPKLSAQMILATSDDFTDRESIAAGFQSLGMPSTLATSDLEASLSRLQVACRIVLGLPLGEATVK